MSFPPVPERKKGRKPRDPAKLAAREAEEMAVARAFAAALEQLHHETGLHMGPRSWAYHLEGERMITKGEFDRCEACIARLRKEGILDPDVVANDKSRETIGVESVDYRAPESYARAWWDFAEERMSQYRPSSTWEGLDYYVEVAVEKKDLLQIFEPITKPLCVPLSNFKGWSDVNTRRHMLKRMRDHYEAGRQPVLLYVGDHDPKGLLISDALKSNLVDCGNIQDVQWNPEPVQVIRIGLTRQQIDDLDLMWINNLETSGRDENNVARDLSDPRHPDHHMAYVRDYIRAHGARKVEANALVGHIPEAKQIMRDALAEFIPDGWAEMHEDRLEDDRQRARDAFAELIRNQGGA